MTNTKLDCIDVFSGIGGISLALKPYVKTVLYCEINDYCQKVLHERMVEKNLDPAPIHNDITTLQLPELVRDTMICGGFPCTDISSIGLQRGILADTKSGLFLEMMRLVDSSDNIKCVFLENVPNIVKRGMKEVLDNLVERGFSVSWLMKSAGEMGAPHQRQRWFCLATRGDFEQTLLNLVDHTVDEESNQDNWAKEPEIRVSFKPTVQHDPTFDSSWGKRCQTLGNTVVPPVVRQAFVELVAMHANKESMLNTFKTFSLPFESLDYPYPESGLISDSVFIPFPAKYQKMTKQGRVKITVPTGKSNKEKLTTLTSFPTPRFSKVYPTRVTERTIVELPTCLVNCKESLDYMKRVSKKKDVNPESVVPNAQYIEWMMGYPENWTHVTATDKNDLVVEREPKPKGPKRLTYNGMHAFMKETPGKDVRTIAKLWAALPLEQKDMFRNKSKILRAGM